MRLSRPFSRRPGRTLPNPIRREITGHPAAVALGVGAVATAALGVVWRAFNGVGGEDAPDQIAAITAQSVANAARASVIEAVEQAPAPTDLTFASATAHAVREAAAAGADLTAAAIGSLEGARIAYRYTDLERGEAVAAARTAAVSAAEEVGPAAAERVRRVLEARADA